MTDSEIPTLPPGFTEVVVTGAAGFIGSALVRRLASAGLSVRAVVAPDKLRNNLFAELGNDARITVFAADIRDTTALNPAFDGAQIAFHCAALVHAWAADDVYRSINVDGCRNVAELSLAHGVQRLVAISTSDVFGLPNGDAVIDETSPHRRWKESYPDTKAEGEAWLWRLSRESGLPLSIIYPGWVYGPGDRAFFPALAKAIQQGRMWFFRRDARLPWIYIDNLVDACILTTRTESARGQGYLIFDTMEGPTLEQVCADIAGAVDARPPRRYLPYPLAIGAALLTQHWWRSTGRRGEPPIRSIDVKAFGNQWRFSNAKARQQLGWQSRIATDEGMRRAIAALNEAD